MSGDVTLTRCFIADRNHQCNIRYAIERERRTQRIEGTIWIGDRAME